MSRSAAMNPSRTLDENEVAACLAAAGAQGREHGWKLSVAVTDAGGHLLGFLRQDGASPLSAQIALAKARTAAMSRRETRFFEELLASGRTGFLSVPDMSLLEGGVPVLVDGECVGGVGVSGATSQQDAQAAHAGVAAALARHA